MMKVVYLIVIIVLSLPMMSCRNASADSEKMSVADGLDSLLSEIFDCDGPGGAVVVMHGDSMIYGRGFGLARLDSVAPVTLNTMFNICSVSKQFSAVALLKLAEQGKLSLDDKVLKFFPALPYDVFKDITLRHLLSHTSGIPDSRPRTAEQWSKYLEKHKSRFDNVEDFKRFCEEDESLEYLTTLDSLNFAPGSTYEYMNPTFQMMLSIVEQASGENFDSWMRANVFEPAGMSRAVYYTPDVYIPDMAHGYERSSDGRWEESDYGEASFFGTKADGGLYTSPLEFVKWDKALFSDRIISAQSREEAHTGRIDTDIPFTQYGYGWFVENRPGHPEKIYHTGDNGGFFIYEGHIPAKDVFYLIFATHPHWSRERYAEKVDSIVLRSL